MDFKVLETKIKDVKVFQPEKFEDSRGYLIESYRENFYEKYIPNVNFGNNSLTKKDKEDLKLALKLGVDWIALSFVETAKDVLNLRKIVKNKANILTKLEKPSALKNLDEIIKVSDAIMIARGDLGIEAPLESLPIEQKKIITACRKAGKPVVVATQMLDSMVTYPTPTKAETSDVATAK